MTFFADISSLLIALFIDRKDKTMAKTIREQAKMALEKSKHMVVLLEGANYSIEVTKDTIMQRMDLAYEAGFLDGYRQALTDIINEEL